MERIVKSFTKTLSITYKPIFVWESYSVYNEDFIRIRSAYKYKCNSCFKCDHKFTIGETIGLASFEGVGNKVLCQTCVAEILT